MLLLQVRNSWGSYWGSLGFFKLQRGVNALQIESGDCWCV
jgi:C1A family cysteine protease